MKVVTARMHHRHQLSARVLRLDRARVWQAGFLLDRQSVQFGAEHHSWSCAVLHDGDDAGATDPGCHVEAQRLHVRGELRGGLRFLKRELGILMQVDVERLDGGIDGLDLRGRRGGPWRSLRASTTHKLKTNSEAAARTRDFVMRHYREGRNVSKTSASLRIASHVASSY